MAETSEALRQIVEKIRDDAEQVLKLLDHSEEKRALAWKCQRCGHIKHFTRGVLADVAAPCPKCRGEVFEPIGGGGHTTPFGRPLNLDQWPIVEISMYE